jgi:hypothetical protein
MILQRSIMATLNLTTLDSSFQPINPNTAAEDCCDGLVQNEGKELPPFLTEDFRDPDDEYIPQVSRLTETQRREATQGAEELHAHMQRLWQEMTSANEEAKAALATSLEIVDGFESELAKLTESSLTLPPEEALTHYQDWTQRHGSQGKRIQESTDQITRSYYKMRTVYREAFSVYTTYWNKYSYNALPLASDSSALLEEMRKIYPPDRLILAEVHYYEQGYRAKLQMDILPMLTGLPEEQRGDPWEEASQSTLYSGSMKDKDHEINSRQDRLIQLLQAEDDRKKRETEALESAIRVRIEEQNR